MKRLALILLLLCVAAPSWATTYWVRQDSIPAQTFHDGRDSSNVMNLAHANAVATHGDVILMLGGVYTTTPVPVQSGTGYGANLITYRSAYNDTASVTVTTGLTFDGSAADSFVCWRSLKFTGSLDFGISTRDVAHLMFSNCRIAGGGINITRAYACSIDSTFAYRVGPALNHQYGIQVKAADTTNTCRRDSIRNTTMILYNVSAAATSGSFYYVGTDCYMSKVKQYCYTGTTDLAQQRFARFAGGLRWTMVDCKWVGVNNMLTGGSNETMNWTFKDGFRLTKMYRDTVIITGSYVTTSPEISFGQATSQGGIGGNSYRSCYFSNQTGSDRGISWYASGMDGDSLVGNTYVSRGSSVYCYYSRGEEATMTTNSIVDHNIFVTFAHANALNMSRGSTPTISQGVVFTNNIFYSSTVTNADSTIRAVAMGTASDWTADTYGPISCDYNMTAMPRSSTLRGLSWSGGTDYYHSGGAWSTANGTAQDTHSRHGTPTFQDTTLANFNAQPLPGSASLFGPDGYVGPLNLSSSAGPWTVTVTPGAHGSTSPGTTVVADGGTLVLQLVPAAGYDVASVTLDGVTSTNPGDWPNNYYPFTNVTANHTFSCTFSAINYVITASAGANGSISPTGDTNNSYGGSRTFTITPDASYGVQSVLIDGVNFGTPTSVTFSNITSNHTVSATFVANASYTITPTIVGSGTVSPAVATTVSSGGSQAFTFTANAGWTVYSVVVDGVAQATTSPYTFSNVTANHTIVITFVQNEQSISVDVSSGTGGSISTTGSSFAAGGGNLCFFICAKQGYGIDNVTVDGVSMGAIPGYTFRRVVAPHSISATFKRTSWRWEAAW